MNCYNKKCINLVTLIISVIIFIQTNFLTIMILNLNNSKETEITKVELQKTNEKENIEDTDEAWKLIIPKIGVNTIIKEGTSGEIINNNIGHFEETPDIQGNIGLIAASAGYKENHFSNLKDLVEGDVIIYIKGEMKKEYQVIKNCEISQTDWSYLSDTKDNRITLITGILENPEKRRCVQAIEIV